MTQVTPLWAYLLAAAVGYGVGAVNPASLIARARGIDLRSGGSGNPGATNAGRLMGKKVGVVVALLDIAKGLLPAVAFTQLASPEAGLVAGFAAVLGHVTSPFLRGRGGKGVATALGAVIGSTPSALPWVLLAFVVVYLVSRWVALASVTAVVVLVPAVWLDGYGAPYVLWATGIAIVVVSRHRTNFVARYRPPER